jgi:anhydro-N-acetylmuramic acid kinase
MREQDSSAANPVKPLTIMGLMSGTSVDAVDACLARFWVEPDEQKTDELKPAASGAAINEAAFNGSVSNSPFRYEIIATHTVPMPPDLRTRLLKVMAEKHIALEEFCSLHVAVGELFAETALGLLTTHNIPVETVDCIGSHGQTIYHWPPVSTGSIQENNDEAARLGHSLQIGEAAIIAEKTGIAVVADFRPSDMAAGGQGAPLVCFADRLLFEDARLGRCIQNIGGIANVTVIPAREGARVGSDGEAAEPVIAFDTGPGNMLIDAAMAHFYGKTYDDDGATAQRGTICEPLLANLLAHPYLQQVPPKTTGREDFGEAFFRELLPHFADLPPADWVATLTRFTAQSLVEAYERFVFPRYVIDEMIVGGGGTYNAFLLASIAQLFAERGYAIAVKTHADFGIPNPYKEALAFAILAWATRCGRSGNVPACTGASKPVILGKLTPAPLKG